MLHQNLDGSRRYDVIPAGAHPWRIESVTGQQGFYRFRVKGENLNFRPDSPDRRLEWSVPDLNTSQYDVSGAAFDALALEHLGRVGGSVSVR